MDKSERTRILTKDLKCKHSYYQRYGIFSLASAFINKSHYRLDVSEVSTVMAFRNSFKEAAEQAIQRRVYMSKCIKLYFLIFIHSEH